MRCKSGNGRLSPGRLGSVAWAVLVVSVVACGPEPAVTPAVTPALSPVAIETPEPTGESAPASTPTAEVSPQPSPTLPPTLTLEPAQATPTKPANQPLTLQVLTPPDSIGVEVGAVRVAGITSGNEIGINGIPVGVLEDGTFFGSSALLVMNR